VTAGTASIGFVGLGAMGGRMVRRLLAAGYTVAVHDVREDDCTTIVRLFESWSGTTISAEHSL